MSSVLSPLKALRPFGLAALAIVCFELLIHLLGTNGRFNTDFFDFSPLRPDVMQKHVLYDKLELLFQDTPADIVQVGDSSGFYGVIPEDVTAGAGGLSYLNLNCCADAGWDGYYQAGVMAVRRPSTPKMLVLHITPIWGPLSTSWAPGLAELMRNYLVQEMWWHRVRPPSAGYRLRLTNLVYHDEWLDEFPYDKPADQPGYPSLRQWRAEMAATRGWIPLPRAYPDTYLTAPAILPCTIEHSYSRSSYFGLHRDDGLYRHLSRFAELTRQHGVRFALITNPLPCRMDDRALIDDVARQLDRFRRDYPDAVVPFEFFRTAERSGFRDRWHLNEAAATVHSRRIGEALRAAW
jgi:hypothetical protein